MCLSTASKNVRRLFYSHGGVTKYLEIRACFPFVSILIEKEKQTSIDQYNCARYGETSIIE